MNTSLDIYLTDGDQLTYRLYEVPSGQKLKLHLGAELTGTDVEVGLTPRAAVALRDMLDTAINAWRVQLGEQWAREFPPTLDLEAATHAPAAA